MKKIYSRPEWELTILETEDVISTSDGDYGFGSLEGPSDKWFS